MKFHFSLYSFEVKETRRKKVRVKERVEQKEISKLQRVEDEMYLLISPTSILTDLQYDRTICTVTSEIGKLLYRFSSRLNGHYYEGPPPLIFTCIGFNFIRTAKEKQCHTTN